MDLVFDHFQFVFRNLIPKIRQKIFEVEIQRSNSRYLSEIGIQTKRDGTLLINEKSFKEAVENDPTSYDAIFNSSITSNNTNLAVSKTYCV